MVVGLLHSLACAACEGGECLRKCEGHAAFADAAFASPPLITSFPLGIYVLEALR